jgi:hypothetical protein
VHHRSFARISVIAVITLVGAIVLTACGSTPGGTNQPSATGTPRSTTVPPTPGQQPAGGLCGIFGQELAAAALGVPLAAPQGGDVVPRGNGIYCHYSAAGDPNTNVEAQFRDMTRAEFDQLATAMGMTVPLPGIGQAAFQLERSALGGAGAAVAAWADGRGVTVVINSSGNQAVLLNGAKAIAAAVLAQA